MVWVVRGTALSQVRAQIETALDDPSVTGILLDVDSPGGEINGVTELSDLIFSARGKKPIVAYTAGECCSAAYWIASAAEKLVASEAAFVGSIGVICSYGIETSDNRRQIDFISSVSPNKNPNPEDPEGAKIIQGWVDEAGQYFVSQVSRNRGVDEKAVLSDFGQGSVFMGGTSAGQKLIDINGNFRDALSSFNQDGSQAPQPVEPKPQAKMKSKIYATSKGLTAELVIVDSEEEGVEIPEDSATVEQISKEWLEQNLPDLVEEIRQEGTDTETERQAELDSIDAAEVEEAEEAKAEAKADNSVNATDTKNRINAIIVQALKDGKIQPEQESPGDIPRDSAGGSAEANSAATTPTKETKNPNKEATLSGIRAGLGLK